MNIGFIGCGRIAESMANTINSLDGFTLYAVSARSYEKALEFKAKYNAVCAYPSYEEMLQDDNVDLVYIATIHPLHKEHMLLCLKYNKPILCEKPFTINKSEASEVFTLARERGIYCAEGIWTRYMKARYLIDSIIESGQIGKVTTITANLGYTISEVDRIKYPHLGGGALLDIGIYPINFALMAAKGLNLLSYTGTCVKNEYGVDIKNSIIMNFESGVQALLFSDATTNSDRRGCILGTSGLIVVDNINNAKKISLYDGSREKKLIKEYNIDSVTGYEYELYEAKECIEKHLIEPFSMSHDESLRVMEIMDNLRKEWGIKLANEI